MAEERIVAVDLKKQCEECKNTCEEYDGFYADCGQCPFAEKAIKRTEAIEHMANAMWKSDNKDLPTSYWETQMKEAKNRYLQRAEAALDALIKGE